jgi:hypothetical protein
VFATLNGMLPSSRRLQIVLSALNLERGLIAGCLIALAGLAMLVSAVLLWRHAHYGGISYPESLRRVIPGVTLVTLGMQTAFSSFFLGLLNLKAESRK